MNNTARKRKIGYPKNNAENLVVSRGQLSKW
jgi:hypothetical protein